MEVLFTCKRCGHETDRLFNIQAHLRRKIPCSDVLECGLSVEQLFTEFAKDTSDYKFSCTHCNQKFKSKHGKDMHEVKCVKTDKKIENKDEIIENLRIENEEIKKENQRLIQQIQDHICVKEEIDNDSVHEQNKRLLIELEYYKNRKNENFYQLLLEEHLGGTHMKLACGITDVTTSECHAEIKEWKSWKEAIGQLTCYNAVEPRPVLAMYMFGKYLQQCKEQALKVAQSCRLLVYEFFENTDGDICIKNMSKQEIVYTYKKPI